MPDSRPTLVLTGTRLQEIRSGLKELIARRLPPGLADQRGAVQLLSLRDAGEAYDTVLRKLQEEERAAMALEEGAEKDAAMADIAVRLDALNASPFEVPAPRTKLTRADLPITWKSKDGSGERNQSGVGLIQYQLAPEFFVLTDPDAPDVGDAAEADD